MADIGLIVGITVPCALVLLVLLFFLARRFRNPSASLSQSGNKGISAQMGFGVERNDEDGWTPDARHAHTPKRATSDEKISTPGPNGQPSGPPSLGLGALFPLAAEKTPSVMTQSVAKGMQEARMNGGAAGHGFTNGDISSPSYGDTIGFGALDPSSIDSSFANDATLMPKILDVGKTPLRGGAHLPQPAFQPILEADAPEEEEAIAQPSQSEIKKPKTPIVPPLPIGIIGLQNTETEQGGSDMVVDSKPINSNIPSNDQCVMDVANGIVQWRDATVIDDTPLQQQFEDFMKQLKSPSMNVGKGLTPRKGVGGATPRRGSKRVSGLTPRAVGQDSHRSSHAPEEAEAPNARLDNTDEGAGTQRSRYVGHQNAQDPQRKKIMDMHKLMFEGGGSMAEPVELPGDKGVSYYQGASSLSGRMTSASMESIPVSARAVREKPVMTEIKDEDEMWG